MSARKWMVASSLVLAVAVVIAAMILSPAAPALGQPDPQRDDQPPPGQPAPQFQPSGFQPAPMGPMGPGMQPFGLLGGSAALAAQGDYVYVVRGNTLYQFRAAGLTLTKKVTLEEEPQFAPMGRPRREPRGERKPQRDEE